MKNLDGYVVGQRLLALGVGQKKNRPKDLTRDLFKFTKARCRMVTDDLNNNRRIKNEHQTYSNLRKQSEAR
jgi:hypothetical protein